MNPKRYLIYFSYIGTQFRGVQRQVNRDLITNADPTTIQGLLEYALSRLKPTNPVILNLASRTDQGVHALKTAGAVDLEFQNDVTPLYIHNFLNGFFEETELDIRILDVFRVSKSFNPRSMPLWRKYVYRFATVRPESSLPKHLIQRKLLPVPITENHRCYFVPYDMQFNLNIMNEASELFIGTKNFVSFMGKGIGMPEEISTIRRIDRLFIEPAQPFIPSSYDNYYNYWHLTCEGKSFLYKQIRKTVAILLAVAQRRISVNTVEKMIEEPSAVLWPKNIPTAPSGGLYLADVFYHPKDLEVPIDEMEHEQSKKPEESKAEINDPYANMEPLERSKLLIKLRLSKYEEKKTQNIVGQA